MFDDLLIADMIDACEAILRFTKGFTREQIIGNQEKLHAIYYDFQVIGEAANKISEFTKHNYTDIPWRKLTTTRNRLVHDYAGIDAIIVMELVETEIPNLLLKLNSLSKKL